MCFTLYYFFLYIDSKPLSLFYTILQYYFLKYLKPLLYILLFVLVNMSMNVATPSYSPEREE